MNRSQQNVFALLQSLEQRGRDHRAELPAQAEVRREWVGVGFRLGGRRLLAPLDEVAEILTCPPLVRVPNTKPWVKGVANVRGTLLPVMDLSGYLGRRLAAVTRLSRVIVVQHEGVSAGLLVDEVLGMRHFFEEERVSISADVDDALADYISGAFVREDEEWLVMSMRALAVHPQFLKVAS